jgi:hypothetical protein
MADRLLRSGRRFPHELAFLYSLEIANRPDILSARGARPGVFAHFIQGKLMAHFDIGAIVRDLHDARQQWRQAHRPAGEVRGIEFPSREALAEIVVQLKGVLFPLRLGPPGLRRESEDFHVAHALDSALHALLHQVQIELHYSAALEQRTDGDIASQALAATRAFAAALPEVRLEVDSDVLAAYQGDPAARSVDEVLLCYPGVLAMIHHRLAHRTRSACRCWRASSRNSRTPPPASTSIRARRSAPASSSTTAPAW